MTSSSSPISPKIRFEIGDTLAPGDRIGSARQISPGIGTYSRCGNIYASIVGTLSITPIQQQQQQQNEIEKNKISFAATIIPKNSTNTSNSLQTPPIPSIGKLVLCRVLRSTPQTSASLEILAMEHHGFFQTQNKNSTSCSSTSFFMGAIRKEDVKSNATEEVNMCDSFRPGDIILGRILSLGDARRYFVSTAEAELGVVKAVCATSGMVMEPISYKEMQCPKTKVKELRKCAKPRMDGGDGEDSLLSLIMPLKHM